MLFLSGFELYSCLVPLSNCSWDPQVIAVLCVEDPAEADRMSLDLPIMKKMGDRVHVECKSIRPIEQWFEDLKRLQNGQ